MTENNEVVTGAIVHTVERKINGVRYVKDRDGKTIRLMTEIFPADFCCSIKAVVELVSCDYVLAGGTPTLDTEKNIYVYDVVTAKIEIIWDELAESLINFYDLEYKKGKWFAQGKKKTVQDINYIVRRAITPFGRKVYESNHAIPMLKEYFAKQEKGAADSTGEAETEQLPDWIIVKETNAGISYGVNDERFSAYFRDKHNLHRIHDLFYADGEFAEDSYIKSLIQHEIQQYIVEKTGPLTNAIFQAVANNCFHRLPDPDEFKIFCADDTTISLDRQGNVVDVRQENVFTLNRINAHYTEGAKCPKFINYLLDLFYREDLRVIQQYIGYCLIPSTKGQKALFIQGKGGEGKSVLKDILVRLFNHAAILENIDKLEGDRFALANLEHKLVSIDDDAQSAKLSETNVIKTLITANGKPLQIERKGVQKRDAIIYARLIALGNRNVGSLHDHSDGFYRRWILIKVKPKTREKDDRFLADDICKSELDGIFLWALKGLQDLLANGYEFHVSQRSMDILKSARYEEDNTLAFIDDDCLTFTNDFSGAVTSADLFVAYYLFCKDNGYTPVRKRTFQLAFGERYSDLKTKIVEGKKANGENNRVNGYKGMILSAEMIKRISELDEREKARIETMQ